ncbi:hypothetical protein FisN_9Hh217 [Fistulifera solaris]|uniref:EGF-like domain-containing protein n=1 Tax=Fistulifera solaris TaxID=1519565 RepID=A0A1Z5JAZ3_FISSO|nr:hypothetical protein FisN_9Hh217 [Fistulifera solaris]|eukprot:GAX11126.1 hypothetical protein FisN_9Hh217 [Fistulifera solaris]
MIPYRFLGLALLMRCEAITHNSVPMEQTNQQSHRMLQLTCSSDEDCASGDYCNRGLCRPGGYCEDALDCKNPSNLYSMIECLGYLYCSSDNECLVQCAGSHCPNYDEVDCRERLPCNVTECSEDYVSCVNDDCGGCNARFFTASGEQACVIENDSVEPGCSSDMDCGEDMYCRNGQCTEIGTCEDTVDCLNPSNAYTDIDCIGYTTCVAGTCEKTCSESECSSEEAVQCYAPPCDVTTCTEEAASCVNTFCGTCRGIFFNAAGQRVCEDARPNGDCGVVDQCEQTDVWQQSMCQAKVFIRTRICRLIQN